MSIAANPKFTLPPRTVTEAVAQALREQILNGALAEGEQLRQDAIAAAFNVSRIPVREALRHLEAEGLAVLQPHRGAVVTRLSTDEIMELFEIRALLEPDVLRHAIPRLSAQDLKRAADLLALYGSPEVVGDASAWTDLNWRFHTALYEPSGRSRSLAVIQNLHMNAERYLRLQITLSDGLEVERREHEKLLALCKSGDTEAACRDLRCHILGAAKSLMSFLAKHRKGD